MRMLGQRIPWPTLTLLLVLFCLDLGFIGLHFTVDQRFVAKDSDAQAYATAPGVDVRRLLEGEGSYSEIFQYAKETLIAVLFLATFWLNRSRFALIGAALFGFLALDDSMALHERTANWMKLNLSDSLPIFRYHNVNEAMMFALVGAVLLALSALALRRSTAGERRAAAILVGLLLALAACGIGFDLLNAFLERGELLTVLEDGGEMIVMSVIVSYAALILTIVLQGRKAGPVMAQGATVAAAD